MQHTRAYLDGELLAEGFDPAEISDYLEQDRTVIWLDLCEPTDAELLLICEEFGLHELAVEDARRGRQRPKVDRYPDHLFLTMYAVSFDSASAELRTTEVGAFAAPRFLITVRRGDDFDMPAVLRSVDESGDLASSGVAFLLHAVLDRVVDGYFEVVDALDSDIEALEDQLFANRPLSAEIQRRSFEVRKSLVALRRVVLPMREVVNALIRRELGIVDERMAPYYQDVYDHVLRATEWTESLRDLVANVLETNLTIQGNALNEIMKKLTSWAAIIAVPTAVTGFYGQNVPYPGFGKESGVWASIAITLALGVALYASFKKRHWL